MLFIALLFVRLSVITVPSIPFVIGRLYSAMPFDIFWFFRLVLAFLNLMYPLFSGVFPVSVMYAVIVMVLSVIFCVAFMIASPFSSLIVLLCVVLYFSVV